jgi:hypothetical protein
MSILTDSNIIDPIISVSGTTDIKFVYGNNNCFTVGVNLSHKVYVLYYIATQVLKSDILYLCCNGNVLGINDIDTPLHRLGYFLFPSQVVSVVLKHPDVSYPTEDLYIYNYIRLAKDNREERTVDYMSTNLITVPESRYLELVTVEQYSGDEWICSICQDGLQSGQQRHRLACGHSFHAECIHRILTTVSVECPTCSYDVREDP